jgi:hypothetical protein
MKFVEPSRFTDADAAASKLMEIASKLMEIANSVTRDLEWPA